VASFAPTNGPLQARLGASRNSSTVFLDFNQRFTIPKHIENPGKTLFKPEPNYHGRNPEGPEELRALARKKMNERQVKVLLDKVTK
jgi:hypothetical protein